MLKRILEYFAARKRGEKRVAPAGVRGRVYVRTENEGGGVEARAEPQASISARVIRADGRVEDHGVIS